jgi:hypothetical protein
VFVGDINVPSLFTVLKQLSISIDTKDACSDMDRVMISRQQLKKTLYENLRPGTVRCRQRVTGIEKRGDGLIDCIMEQANDDETQDTKLGPFHVVVAADGVRSLFRTCRLKNVALVGDARWAQDRWWDFGYGRIHTGANVAMVDGLELGKLLLQDARKFCNVQSNDISPNSTLGHFSAEEKRREILMKRSLVLAIFIAFLSRILSGGFDS